MQASYDKIAFINVVREYKPKQNQLLTECHAEPIVFSLLVIYIVIIVIYRAYTMYVSGLPPKKTQVV